MSEGEHDKDFGGAGDKLRDVTVSKLCEDGSFIDQFEEEEERRLQRRNEEVRNSNRAGANFIVSDSMPAEKGRRKSICTNGSICCGIFFWMNLWLKVVGLHAS